MKFFNAQITGSMSLTGSFEIPVSTTTGSYPNLETGSLLLHVEGNDRFLRVFNGTSWVKVSEQSTPPASADIEYLVIGGGGSGGQLGGGGAGGHLSGSFAQVTSGSSLTVTVGGGGAPVTSVVRGNTGTDSSIAVTGYTTATALGGGGGGGQGAASDAGTGKDGGSGGGGGENDAGTNTPGSGTAGQGNDGGTGGTGAGTQLSGGGGGGAGAAGSNAPGQSSGGAGGNGLTNKITGTSVTRAGGGGGGAWYYNNGGSSYGGAGGSGGGGAAGTTGNTAAVSGTANTGGGGGGAGFTSAGWWITDSGTGGSGVAVLAYDSGSINAAGGIVGSAGNSRKYHQFNSTGTFKVGNSDSFQIHSTNLVMHIDAGNFDSRGTSTTGYDLTSYGNDINLSGQSGGSLTDNPWWNCDGTGGLADFDRNGVSAASDVSHTGYGSFTGRTNVGWCIDFWVKTTATGGWASGGKTIIGRNSGDIYANITIYNNKANWNHYNGSWQNESSTTSINDGSWHHCAFNNHSDETIDIWVDGVKENDGAASAVNPDTRYFKMDSIGRGYSGQNTAMDFAQCRVYDTTLTDAQILQNYNATKTNFV